MAGLAWCRKIIWIGLVLLSCYLIAYALLQSSWLQNRVRAQVEAEKPAALEFQTVDLNWSGSRIRLSLGNVIWREAVTQSPVIQAKAVQLYLNPWHWLKTGQIQLATIKVVQATAQFSVIETPFQVVLSNAERKIIPWSHLLSATEANVIDKLGIQTIEFSNCQFVYTSPYLGQVTQLWQGRLSWPTAEFTDWQLKAKQHWIGKQLGIDWKQVIELRSKGGQSGQLSLKQGQGVLAYQWSTEKTGLHWRCQANNLTVSPFIQQLKGISVYPPLAEQGPAWLWWLSDALKAGTIQTLSFEQKETLPLQGRIQFDKATLLYDTNWPPVEAMTGVFTYKDGNFTIQSTQARILGHRLPHLEAQGQVETQAGRYRVRVDGVARPAFPTMVSFVSSSPLSSNLGRFLSDYRASAKIDLNLKLFIDIPLASKAPVQVTTRGKLAVEKLQLEIPQLELGFQQGRGEIQFSEKSLAFSLEQVQAQASANWPLSLPKHGKVTGSFSWGSQNRLYLSARYEDAIDCKLRFLNQELDAGSIWIEPKATEKTLWPAEQDKSLLVNSPNVECQIFNSTWAKGLWKSPIELGYLRYKSSQSTLNQARLKKAFEEHSQALNLRAEELWIDEQFLGAFTLRALPSKRQIQFEQIELKHPHFQILATGFWSSLSNRTQLKGSIQSANMGRALRIMERNKPNLQGGKLQANFDVQYAGLPIDIGLPKLVGQLNVELKEGRLLDLNIGFARLISLLSLDNLKRRLQLDFRDVFKKGFFFDEADFRVRLNQADWFVEQGKVISPTADVMVKGKTNMNTKAIQFSMMVFPKSLVSGMPLAAATLAGGPVFGAGLFLFDKVFAKNNQKTVLGLSYEVTGTWDKPILEKSLSLP